MASCSATWWSIRRWFDSKRILVETETQRAVLVIVAITVAVFLSGTFMGINSLQSVWAKQGHYLHLCNETTNENDPPIMVLPDAVCQKQAMKLLMLSHVASGFTYAMIPITGILTDWQGARRVFGGVIVLLLIGNLIAIIPNYWTQFIGTTLMSGMGPCLAFNLLVWAQLVPGWTRWVAAIVTAAFPGGSFFLALLRLAVLYGHFTISAFFALWLIVTIPSLYLFVIWPRGIGKPYAASHPLLMLAYYDILKRIMLKIGIPIPNDADSTTMVELEEIYSSDKATIPADASNANLDKPRPIDDHNDDGDEDTVKLDFESFSMPTAKLSESAAAKTEKKDTTETKPEETTSGDTNKKADTEMVALDNVTATPEQQIKTFKWMDQLNSVSIVLLQGYFLFVCVWLALVANLGAYRMAYWANKTGGDAAGIEKHMLEAKAFLPNLELINVVSIFTAPVAAIVMKSVGVPGASLITHIVATISAMLCLSTSFNVQILNFYLFPVVRGLMYPFSMMFLIQTCGRRHLGLLWALTISGASPTDFIRTFLIKFWLYRSNSWDVLNGVQLVIIGIAWIWPVYAWVKRESWEEEHPEPLS